MTDGRCPLIRGGIAARCWARLPWKRDAISRPLRVTISTIVHAQSVMMANSSLWRRKEESQSEQHRRRQKEESQSEQHRRPQLVALNGRPLNEQRGRMEDYLEFQQVGTFVQNFDRRRDGPPTLVARLAARFAAHDEGRIHLSAASPPSTDAESAPAPLPAASHHHHLMPGIVVLLGCRWILLLVAASVERHKVDILLSGVHHGVVCGS